MVNIIYIFMLITSQFVSDKTFNSFYILENQNDLNFYLDDQNSSKDTAIINLTRVLEELIKSKQLLKIEIGPDVEYQVLESRDTIIKFCNYFQDQQTVSVLQMFIGKSSEVKLEINQTPIKIVSISIEQSIEGYPFFFEMNLDCSDIKYHWTKLNGKSYLAIFTVPMNWTGLMTSKYAYYILIDLDERIGVQTIASRIYE